jgi:cystathionine beta-lyase/cystathionine gamma-synthase
MRGMDPQDALICLRAGEQPADGAAPVLPPIVQASLFRHARTADLLDGLAQESRHTVYSRGTNPGVRALETSLAALERAEDGRCFGSGMAAIAATLFALLDSGDHILFAGDIYGPTLQLAGQLERFGVTHSQMFPGAETALADIESALTPQTRLIFTESPGTMRFGLLPLEEIAALARSRGILTAIDNTVATPLLQKPLTLGVDLALHSCSKYIGGHSDVIGGAVLGREDLVQRIFERGYMLLGGIQAPLDAFLLSRGLMTLPARLKQHSADGETVARALAGHPRIRRVFHPALDADAAGLFARQMRGHSGLFSVEIDAPDFDRVCAILDRLRLFGRAVSWGGVESLVIPAGRPDGTDPRRPFNLVRLSIGLEGAEALIDDLDQALER